MDSGSFGEALRDRRVRTGLTQRELAGLAGVSVRSVRSIEQGRVLRPRRESVQRLAEAVGLALDADWRWTGPDDGGAGNALRVGVLGRLEVVLGTRPVEVGSVKQRCVLALLALQPNRVVPREEIIDALWGEHPPDSCLNLVHTYVSRLRKAAAVISSARGGYRLTVDGHLDLVRFDELVDRARAADPEGALANLEAALRLWRGPVVSDLPDGVRRHPAALAVSGRRVAAALALADLALELGRHSMVVDHLRALVHEEPLHEGLYARLMLGLAGSGQQAAAFRLFAEIRTRLSEELGIEPGPEIVAAHLRIIRNQVPASAIPNRPSRPEHPTPAHLPADIGGFTGRGGHLERLDTLLRDGGARICTVAGTAGVGKTALAVHWAQRVRGQFPDGQLYVNLRGYAATSPVRPLEALTRFLHALGLPAERVPVDEEEAVGLYRTMLADRKVLILLDNAGSAEQVRPLLPGSRGCFVVITSRDRLASLSATEGAHRITLDVLDPVDARMLLTRMIGADRVDAGPAIADLAEACAYLPLALRIVAANLAFLPHTSISDYTDELRKRGRLTELVVEGDDGGAVRAAFDLSYDSLDPDASAVFRLLGVVPGPDFTVEVAAALSGRDAATVRRLMDQLAGAHLVHEHTARRYQFHDLLREYAAERARAEDGASVITEATTRLYEFYVRATDAATRLLYPHMLRMPGTEESTVDSLAPASEPAAISWLDAELPNLVAAAAACPPELLCYTWRLADSLRGYFITRGHSAEGLNLCRVALAAAQEKWDPHAEASMNDILGNIHYNLSDYAKATGYHTRSLALNRRIGNQVGEASALHNLGRVHSQLGKPTQALLYYEQALTLNRRLGDRHGEGSDLNYVGVAWLSRGRPDRAIAHHRQALELSQELGSRTIEFISLNGLGLAYWARGELREAIRTHTECLEVCRAMGHRLGEANTLVCLAETNCDAGRYQEAYEQAKTCITMCRQLGERRSEVGGLDVLATVHLRRGHHEVAARYYVDALQMAREIGFGFGETSILIGLSTALRGAGRLSDALTKGHDALAVLQDSGMRLLEGRALIELALAYLELGDLDQSDAYVQRALRVVRERGQRLAEARALCALGLIRRAAGERVVARGHWQAALELFTEIGTPEAAEVQALLAP